MEIKKSTLFSGIIFLVLIVGGFLFFSGGRSAVNGNVVSEGGQVLQGETQKVVIGEKNLN